MLKILLSLLVATTAATPAMAQRASSDEREERRTERAQERQAERAQQPQQAQPRQRAQRPERAQRPQQAQQPQRAAPPTGQVRPVQRVERAPPRAVAPQASPVRERAVRANPRAANINERGHPVLERQRQAQTRDNSRRQNRPEAGQERRARGDWANRQTERPRRVAPPAGARPDRMAPPPVQTSRVRAPTWSTDWRRDRRHDWRGHRERNRSNFRIGIYFDPFGWNYRRHTIGWRLWPSYYNSNYWLNDPFMYRLPHAPWPYRWVRYYDDVILVNTMNGQVVDVIYDFFW